MGSLEEFVEATQIAQATVIQFALETYRRRKPKMSCVALCHFMTHVPDIKLGVSDYYGKKKLAFDWLQRTYQPLLPSLQFDKRRWNAGSEFKGGLWIVNDHQFAYQDHVLEWRVLYEGQDTGASGSQVVEVEADSSAHFTDISWALPETASGEFEIDVAIKNNEGETVAANHYTLLVGDQEAAKSQSLKYLDAALLRLQKHGHSVYRYWPEMWEEFE